MIMKSKKDSKDQEPIQSSTTPVIFHYSDNLDESIMKLSMWISNNKLFMCLIL